MIEGFGSLGYDPVQKNGAALYQSPPHGTGKERFQCRQIIPIGPYGRSAQPVVGAGPWGDA